MKPYIFTHMMMSVDGRIDCPMVDQLGGDEYYVTLAEFGLCSKLSGRNTSALECSAVESAGEPMAGNPTGKPSFYRAKAADEYTIVVDTYGKLRWHANEADGHPVLCIVSEQASEAYLAHLHEVGISWIAVGAERIDLAQAMEILHEQFGVERVAVVGGGHICGGFLEAGLLDEVSILLGAGIDGRAGQTAVFDGIHKADGTPYKLKLSHLERRENDIIWIRYTTK